MSRVNWGAIPIGTVLPFYFESNDGTTGASEALSGLAVTDIEIYKGVSITQRSSDAGYVLLDTDGIDVDGIVGLNGFSVDTGDNTDAGFFAAGSVYTVVVASVTIDAVTVNFVAGTFRLVAAEGTAGTPVADATRWNNLATVALPLIPTVAGRTLDVSAGGEGGVDWANVGSPTTTLGLTNTTVGIVTLASTLTTYTGNTVQTGDSFARIGVAGAGLTNIDLPNQTMDITGNITGNLSGTVGSVTGAVGSVTGAVGSVTGAVGSVTGNVGGNVTGSVGSVVGAVGSVTGLTASDVGAIKTKTDFLPSATAGGAGGVFIAGSNAATTVNVTGNITGNLSGSVGSVTGAVGSVTGAVGSVSGAVGSVTAGVTVTTNNDKTGYRLDATGSAALTEGYAAVGATATLPQLLYAINQFLQEFAIAGTTITVKKLDQSTTAQTLTLDSATTPTSLTRTT